MARNCCLNPVAAEELNGRPETVSETPLDYAYRLGREIAALRRLQRNVHNVEQVCKINLTAALHDISQADELTVRHAVGLLCGGHSDEKVNVLRTLLNAAR